MRTQTTVQWEMIISEIIAARRVSDAQIASRVGVTKEAIRKLRKGITDEPLYSTGSQLLILHVQACPQIYEHGEKSDWVDTVKECDGRNRLLKYFRSYAV